MIKQARYLSLLGVGLSASAVVGWLLLRENRRERDSGTVTIRSQRTDEGLSEIVLPLEDLEVDGVEEIQHSADDLTQIHDIGPRFSEALKKIGIDSFARLAAQNPEDLAEKLAEYVSIRPQRIIDNNWIGQAAQRTSAQS